MRLLFCLFFIINIAFAQNEQCCGKSLFGTEAIEEVNAVAKDTIKIACAHGYVEKDIQVIIDELREKYFPELQNISIDLKTFSNDEYYLDTKFGNIFKNAKKREYSIRVNEKFVGGSNDLCPPSYDALRAILAHELFHIVDYVSRNTFGMIGLGTKYLPLNKKARAKYERSADERVLKLGLDKQDTKLIDGLKAYRYWIYGKIKEEDLATKKRFYFTPEEIDTWVKDNNM